MKSLLSKIFKIKYKNGYKKIYFLGINILSYINTINIKSYANWINDLKNNKSLFVPFTKEPFARQKDDVKVFAYYLTQFHAIKENDEAHGKGFTEWTNVASCVPQYIGHYQPKIPYDVGFYNLLAPGIMERQVEIAKTYGIYGFCFYYYWFSGTKALEKPLEYFLNSDIDFKFHLCWANENWSKLWDGGNKEIIFEQKLQDDDAQKFFTDILPYIKDKRYEKIGNKPLLMIYRPSMFTKERFNQFLDELNRFAKNEGFDGFYFMASGAQGFSEPKEYGCEGIIEFPPHKISAPKVDLPHLDSKARFTIFDLSEYITKNEFIYDADYKVFKTCFPSWDNCPRKVYSNGWCFLLSDEQFAKWFSKNIEWTREHNSPEEQYVYINAWNEWGEGAVLEPTTRYGYKYLNIIKQCLENMRKK